MSFDSLAVVGTNLDIDSNHTAMAHRLTQRGIENQRSTVCNAGFDDHVGLDTVDDLLRANHVLWKLNDWPTHPRKGVRVMLIPVHLEPQIGKKVERFIRIEGKFLVALDIFYADGLLNGINRYIHTVCLHHSIVCSSLQKLRFTSSSSPTVPDCSATWLRVDACREAYPCIAKSQRAGRRLVRYRGPGPPERRLQDSTGHLANSRRFLLPRA